MQKQLINQRQVLIAPLQDTWRAEGKAGTWIIEAALDFSSLSTEEINNWYIDKMVATLNVFSELVRAWKVIFSPSSESKISGIVIEWQVEQSYDEYIQNVLKAMKDYPAGIEELEIKVDLFCFVRTFQSPEKPVQSWIRCYDEFLIRGGLEFGDPYFLFSIKHTLFCPSSCQRNDNKELYSLNQPLLENALRRWEQSFGQITEFEGVGTIYNYGFLPEEQKNKS